MRPNDGFLGRRASSDVDNETRYETPQMEALVEPVSEGCEVVVSVLPVLHRVERAGQRSLEISKHRIDPRELGQVAWLKAAHDERRMGAAGLGHSGEATQSVAHDAAARCVFQPIVDGISG